MRNEHGTEQLRLHSVEICPRTALRDPNRSMMLVPDCGELDRILPARVMRYLELVLYAFIRFVIWYSVVLFFGIVAVELATCPAQSRFVQSERTGAVYVCDRNGAIARLNAVLRQHRHQDRGGG